MKQRFLVVFAFLFVPSAVVADDWPQWRGPNRDGVWSESGILSDFGDTQVKIKWRAPISSGYSGPTVADGLVYVTDRVVEPNGGMISFVTDDVDGWYRHLLDNGVSIAQAPHRLERFGIYTFFVRDPNGYLIEFQQFDA